MGQIQKPGAMSGYRITKVVCPSCRGSGSSRLLGGHCLWCDGESRIDSETLEHWSQWLWTIAVGGYLADDHGLDECRLMQAEVNACRRLAELPELRS